MSRPRRDLLIAAFVVISVYFFAAYFEMAEFLSKITRQYESLQVDEIPVVLFALATMAAWYAYRRLAELRQESAVRAMAETELAKSQRLYKSLFDDALSGNFVADDRGHVEITNRAFLAMLGGQSTHIELKQLLGLRWIEIKQELLTKHFVECLEMHLNRPDGAIWVVSARFLYVSQALGSEASYGKIHGFIYDITELYLAEREMAQLFRQNQELARHAMQVQEDERKRLAQEIHDDLGQYLTAIRLDAASLPKELDSRVMLHGDRIIKHAEHIQHSVKSLIRQLRPKALDEHGLIEAVNILLQEWRLQQPEIVVRQLLDYQCNQLPEKIAIVAYRVVQESLTNVAKHAKHAAHVEVSVQLLPLTDGAQLKIVISDDGLGCVEAKSNRASFGLLGMSERVESVQGVFQFMSKPKQGTKVLVTIPVVEA